MSKKLVLLRSLPWCGKSFTALEIWKENPHGVILSTDDYWYQVVEPEHPEKYSFDLKLLGQAHHWNQKLASDIMESGCPLVIIDNTNTTISEAKVYAEIGFLNDYDIQIQEPTSDRWKIIRELLLDKKKNQKELSAWASRLAEGSKGIHNVPATAIEKMMSRWHNNMVVGDLI
jgi:hypothetical protein